MIATGETVAVTDAGYAPVGVQESGTRELLKLHPVFGLIQAGLLCNDAELTKNAEPHWTVAGDQMKGALLALAAKG